MELLLGEGTCDLALQNWRQTIDKIIEVAQKSSNTAIEKKKQKTILCFVFSRSRCIVFSIVVVHPRWFPFVG